MSHQVYAFEPPDRFVVGTVGEPGERAFYLQASGGGRLVSVALEKVQVTLLADKLDELLGEASRRFGVQLAESGTAAVIDNDPLTTPVDEEFRVGTLGLAFDVATSTVVIEAIEVGEVSEVGESEDDEEIAENLNRLRVRITPEATRAFIERARRVVAAGRPPCPLCGQPLSPRGHICPRHNGYHRTPEAA